VLRFTLSVLLLAFAVQAAQAQLHGVPASATSPTSDGNGGVVLHGIPSSVTSPTPVRHDQARFIATPHPRVRFGGPHVRREHKFVPVPVFYPVYDYPADNAAPPVDQAPAAETNSTDDSALSDDALQQAYNQGVRDALTDHRNDPRYGNHYLDSREKRPSQTARAEQKPAPMTSDEPAKEQRDNSPATVFIFKDGHKVETRSYAIVGQTLFDFSSSPLTKLQIADLDVDATRKANNDLGISLTLP
jgi:hypothetical protein